MRTLLPKSLFVLLVSVVTLALWRPALRADGKPLPRITGTYSDMHYVKEAGDVLGTELKIVFTGTEFQGALQIAEGAPGPLILVSIQQEGSTISFTLPEDSPYAGTFSGSIVGGTLRGEFRSKGGGSQAVVLRRGKSYWD